MSSGKFSAAIFDLDGGVVDTAEFHYLAWKEIADELGVAFDRKKNERLRWVPRMRSLEIIVEDAQAGIDAAKAAGMFAVGIAPDEELHGAALTVRAPSGIPLSLWGLNDSANEFVYEKGT